MTRLETHRSIAVPADLRAAIECGVSLHDGICVTSAALPIVLGVTGEN
jgi:hypothetical protein